MTSFYFQVALEVLSLKWISWGKIEGCILLVGSRGSWGRFHENWLMLGGDLGLKVTRGLEPFLAQGVWRPPGNGP